MEKRIPTANNLDSFSLILLVPQFKPSIQGTAF